MRLTDAYTKLNEQAQNARAAATSTTGAATPAPKEVGSRDAAGSGVHVHLSDRARELAAKADASFDEAKVARLRQAVSEGSLKVDSKAIASKIVDGG